MVGKRSQQGAIQVEDAATPALSDQKIASVSGVDRTPSEVEGDNVPDDVGVPPQRKKEAPFGFIITWRFWAILVLGQILSWCIVSTNTFTEYLSLDGANIPAFQTLFNYVLLNVVYTAWTWYKYGFKKWGLLVWKDGWKYFVLGFADVQGVSHFHLAVLATLMEELFCCKGIRVY